MIIYNVTVSIEKQTEKEWVEWMRTVHVPEVIATGCFIEARMSKVMTEGMYEETPDPSYSIQYLCKTQQDYERYQTEFAPQLQQAHTQKYANKFGAFRTLLDVVEIFQHG